jgi:hypothetical protein
MPKSFSISGFLMASIPASATASGNLSGEAVARTTYISKQRLRD